MSTPAARKLLACLLVLAGVAACVDYSVHDGAVVDRGNARVQLRGVNWFGFETSAHLVGGLWARRHRELIAEVKAQGFNAVRLPVCSDTLHGAAIQADTVDLALNPEFAGLDGLQALDRIVGELDRQGFYVLLDLHTPHCADISPLWQTADYSEAQWLDDLRLVARRYGGTRHVIGVDLKNEPHDAASWGTGNPQTDWNGAAERAARAVLAEAPHWLIFVEGIQNNPACSSGESHFWGENLGPLACTRLDIPADKLVLSPHTYGPDVGKPAYFDAADFPLNMPAIWERNFGRHVQAGYALVPGEFGGFYGEGDPRDVAWQRAYVAYLNTKGIRSGFYWTLNPNSKDTGGLLRDDWLTWRTDKLQLLRSFWNGTAMAPVTASPQPSPPAPAPAPPAPPAAATPAASVPPPAATAGAAQIAAGGTHFSVVRSVDNDWGKGYCVRYAIRNEGGSAGDWRVDFAADGHISNLWKGRWVLDGATVHVSGEDYNRSLEPGGSTDFGYCATRG